MNSTWYFLGTWIAIFVSNLAFFWRLYKVQEQLPATLKKELLVKVQKIPEHLVPDLSIGFAARASLEEPQEPPKP